METACKLRDTPGLGLVQVSSEVVVAFRYHDVMELSVTREAGNMPIELLAGQSTRRETGAWRSGPEPASEQRALFRMLADQAFTHNPPLHKFTRRTLSRQILRQNMLRLLPLASEITGTLLAGIRGRSEIDFAADFARPYITRFWGDVLGLTREESAEVSELMRDMNRMFLMQRTPGDSEIIDQATDRYVEIVTRRVDHSLAGRDNQLIQEMAADLAGIDVEGKPESLGKYVAANLFDGFHTVGVAVSNALYVLLAADKYEEMRQEPSLVPRAFHESLRIAPPLLLTHRYALSDIVHNGVLLPAGTAIAMLWGSPGFDPDVFDDPWQFRWDREQRVLFTFGGGPHLCPGKTAAQVLVDHSLSAFVEHGIRWRLIDGHSYRWWPASSMRELVDFPIEMRYSAG